MRTIVSIVSPCRESAGNGSCRHTAINRLKIDFGTPAGLILVGVQFFIGLTYFSIFDFIRLERIRRRQRSCQL